MCSVSGNLFVGIYMYCQFCGHWSRPRLHFPVPGPRLGTLTPRQRKDCCQTKTVQLNLSHLYTHSKRMKNCSKSSAHMQTCNQHIFKGTLWCRIAYIYFGQSVPECPFKFFLSFSTQCDNEHVRHLF